MDSNIFNQLTSAESLLFIIIVTLAFVLGMICMWFLLRGRNLESNKNNSELH